ncbi:DUF4307 domain-containing protein [Mycobacterium sp. ACS4331]|uniref:DUF4307 domain-containing protein n=1 Tax=Mycobacterium sp. ACS4331 TaxID=1834121 RepID=UPI0007FED471|nr:DUF4307 domain-containing protein [Mycobacterium sp. ACS4331]OBF19973.1 hypothetical protein A5727_09470 [Mycobacterium sp. ACS4331]
MTDTSNTDATPARPESRYGKPQRGPSRMVIAALTVLVIAIGIVVATVAYQRWGSGDVKGELASYRLIDDQTVEVTVSVTRADPSQPVVCIVRGRSKDGSETGRRELLVPPSTESTVQVTGLVKTSKPPVVGDVYGCGADVPGYLVEEPRG